jgi:enoyl-CoA hydratase/carnithine racemase
MTRSPHLEGDLVKVEWQRNIAIVTLNVAENNTLSAHERLRTLHTTLLSLDADDEECRAIVLAGPADGFHFGEHAVEAHGSDQLCASTADTPALRVFRLLVTGRKPVIAVVQGKATGLAFSLIAACDYVVASSTSSFACSFGDGLLPEGCFYWTLARRLRAGRARAAMLTARVFSAQDAFKCGLANLIVDPDEVLDEALKIAARYAAMPRAAIACLKVAMATGSDTLEQAIETETNVQPLLRFTEDYSGAVQAFRQKRGPQRQAADSIVTATPAPGVRVDRRGRVAILTIDNPMRRNALSRKLRQELSLAMKHAMADETVGAVILTGAGGHFSAGADISEMRERSVPEYRTLHDESAKAIREMLSGPKPVIAAVEGVAYGAGLSLACAADFVVSSRTARFCAAFIRVGLLPDIGILWTLPQKVGRAKAAELMALATEFDAEEAIRLGLASQLSEAGHALDDALVLADSLVKNPPIAMALTKSALTNFNHSLAESLNVEIDYQSILRATDDHQEAVRAFIEKRAPLFSGH